MGDIPRVARQAIVWLLIATGIFLAFEAWQAREQAMRVRVDGTGVTLQRGPDGHFHWPGAVQGQAVEFLVDTGATRTALPEALARRAGLERGPVVRSSTAGGMAEGWLSQADLTLEGGVTVERLPVVVLPRLDSPLLGMDVLGRLVLQQRQGQLRIEAPTAR